MATHPTSLNDVLTGSPNILVDQKQLGGYQF